MKKELVIIKIGGSVITDKSKSKGGFRKEIVSRLAREIVEAKKKKKFELILVHGAGSYAHFLTTKYRIAEGFLGEKSALGYAFIKRELFRLNNLVWNECLRAGLVVCTVQPSAVVFTSNGQIKSFDLGLIKALLKMGMTPLLMGDDVIDDKNGIVILSGDKTLAYLGRKLKANMIIFVSDIDGVFDKNPKVYKDANPIREINEKNFDQVVNSMESYSKTDASGEMRGKLWAIKDALLGIETRIIGGFRRSAMKDVLLGKNLGTKIFLLRS